MQNSQPIPERRGAARRHSREPRGARRARAAHAAATLALALALAPAAAGAQQVSASLGVGGGVATDARGVRSSAATVTPSLVVAPDPRLSLGLSGSATRFAEATWALGGTASAALRLPLGPYLALAASGLAGATATSFDASYGTLAAEPTLEARLGPATLFAGAQVVRGTSELQESVRRPGDLLRPGDVTTTTERETRRSTALVFGALATYTAARPGTGATLLYREDRARVTGVAVTDRTLTATATSGRLQLSASGGLRRAPDERASYGSVGAIVALTSALALQAGAGTYPSNRVTAVPAGRFASIGLLLHGVPWGGGRAARARAVAAPARLRGAPAVPAGATRLVLRAPGARRVEIAGDWSEWQPVPARRAADGAWYADVVLPRGEYRYAFRVDGARWAVPDDAPSVDDGFGGRSAIVVVP